MARLGGQQSTDVLRRIGHRHSAAGESIGTGRPYLRRTLVGEHLSPTPQRTTGESAGVTGAHRSGFAIRIGDRDSAAGEPVGADRTYSGSATIRKRVGLTLQGTRGWPRTNQIESCAGNVWRYIAITLIDPDCELRTVPAILQFPRSSGVLLTRADVAPPNRSSRAVTL